MDVKSNLLSLAQADVEVSEMILSTTNDELKQNMAAYHVVLSSTVILLIQLLSGRFFRFIWKRYGRSNSSN